MFARNSIVGAMIGSSALLAGCLQTAPTGPGDTPVLNVSNPGGQPSVDVIGIAGAPAQAGGAQATNTGALDAGVPPATTAGPGSVGPRFTGTGGTGFSGTQTVGSGFTGTGGTGFTGAANPDLVGSSFVASGVTDATAATFALAAGTAVDGINRAPIASFVIEPPCLPEQETTVTLSSTSVDPDGDVVACEWSVPTLNIGSDNGCQVSGSAFLNADGIPIELTVRDGRGGASVARALLLRCLQ